MLCQLAMIVVFIKAHNCLTRLNYPRIITMKVAHDLKIRHTIVYMASFYKIVICDFCNFFLFSSEQMDR